MKKIFLFLGPVLILGLALSVRLLRPSTGTETDYPSALMWDGTVYYRSVQEAGQIPESTIVGTISSETDTFPRKNGQANCCPPGTPVAETEEGLAILVDGVWRLCRAKEAAASE